MRGTDMRQTIMLMAACAALLAGCTNEVGEGLGIDTPIQVTASVEGIMTTRADNTTDNLDNFGLSIKDGTGYTGNYAGENIKVTGNNTNGWTFSDNKTVLYKGGGQSYYAYAPYKEGHTGESLTFNVDANQATNGLQGSDLLHAAGKVESAKLDITLAHKLSKLTVTLTPEGFGTDGVKFTGVTLRGTLPTTTLALEDGDGVKAGDLGQAEGTAANITMCPTGTAGTYECILVPQAATYSVLINATVGSEQKTYVYTSSAAYKFESDRSYTLALKVKKADEPTAIESIDVKGWDASIALEDGEATEPDYTIDAEGHYTVYTAEGLLAWMEAADGEETINCTLAADIDMSYRGWRRIEIYSGTFDGNGHTITGLGDCLISSNKGTVRNLILAGPTIFAEPIAGAVACYNYDLIENCHVVGGEIIGGIKCGGIAGENSPGGSILACSSSAEVTGSGNFNGGIAGNNAGRVLACYATGSVTGDYFNGAIVGHNYGGITTCYWSGEEENGVGDGSADGVEEVAGDDWTTAMYAMNTALTDANISYHWIENPDDKTGNRPLIIATK